jgi:hypothetical protein|tara:strand:+ start:690 stop:968 length:279 start_codon:yes stop_codon:yes gene_type:complete
MATSTKDRQVTKRRFDLGSGVGGNFRNMGLDVRHPSESGAVVVAVLLMLFVCLVIPLMAMLYFDTLTLQKKTEKTEARIEKLVKDLEKKEKQ